MRTNDEDFTVRPAEEERRLAASLCVSRCAEALSENSMTPRQERAYSLSLMLIAETAADEFVRLSDALVAAAETKHQRVDMKKTDLNETLRTRMETVYNLFNNIETARKNRPKVIKTIVDSFVVIVSKLRELLESGARYQRGNALTQLLYNSEFHRAAHDIYDKGVKLLKSDDVDAESKEKLEKELPRVKRQLSMTMGIADTETEWRDIRRLSSRDDESR